MLKIAIASIFLGASLLGFSEEPDFSFDEFEAFDDSSVYEQIHLGNTTLLYQNYAEALEHFNDAEFLNNNSFLPLPELHFLICFGRAIAYDNLGMDDRCEQAIGSLFLTAYGVTDDEDEDPFEEEDPAAEEMLELMKQMASLARSPKVRAMLTDLVSSMSEED